MYDHIADTNLAELSQLSTLLDVPEFVKEASDISTAETIKGLSSDNFADPMTRSFPIGSKADTWLSMAYMMKHAEEIPAYKRDAIASRLMTALNFWDIKQSDFKHKHIEKTASAPLMELVYETNGNVYHKAPLCSQEDMEKAACDVIANRSKYPYPMRNSVCRQLLKQASYLSNLPEDIIREMEKTAGYVRTSARDYMNGLMQRVESYKMHKQLQHEKVLLGCYKEAMEHAEDGIITPEYMDKTARLIDYIDRLSGLHTKVQPAEECWDGMTQKDASFIQDKVVTLKNGQKVLAPMLQKHAGNVRQFLNDVAIPTTEADNLLEKVASMPIETVDLFCRIYGDTLSKPSEG